MLKYPIWVIQFQQLLVSTNTGKLCVYNTDMKLMRRHTGNLYQEYCESYTRNDKQREDDLVVQIQEKIYEIEWASNWSLVLRAILIPVLIWRKIWLLTIAFSHNQMSLSVLNVKRKHSWALIKVYAPSW